MGGHIFIVFLSGYGFLSDFGFCGNGVFTAGEETELCPFWKLLHFPILRGTECRPIFKLQFWPISELINYRVSWYRAEWDLIDRHFTIAGLEPQLQAQASPDCK